YATDASNYRHPPIGVVVPKSAEDVVETVAVCREHAAPIVMRGGGTALAGQTVNTAVVIDCSKYVNRILDLDYEQRRARVQPGVIFDAVRTRAEEHGLTLAFDTSTHDRATIGGMLANNACGVHSVLAQMEGHGSGRAADNVDELEIVTYDGCRMRVGATGEDELEAIIRAGGRRGEIYGRLKALRDRYADLIRERYPDIPRRVSGYNLIQLLPEKNFHVARALVGSEGTLATFLEATVALIANPPARVLLVLGYDDVYATGDHAAEVLAERPVGLEALDSRLLENMKRKGLRTEETGLLPEGGGWLLAEFGGGSPEEAAATARRVMGRLGANGHGPNMKLFTDREEQESVWSVRESGLGATAYVPGHRDQWPGWEDSAVPPERVGDYLRDLRALLHKHGYEAALYGHFGQGCIHCRIDFDLSDGEGVKTWRRFLDEAADLVVRYGGSLSGEHGDGQARAELLPKMYGEEIVQAFREFKGIWDPDNRMNPGKIVDPYPMDANLRMGPGSRLREVETHFGYAEDGGSFRRAVMRCVGVGKCRRHGGGVMCPSFMATHEEEHSTRGRSRALYEMLHGGIIEDGWRSEAVRDALDLCLACKGCRNDCPVNVDMATYKAEFMAHHYRGRLRPRSAYSMGLIYWWSRVASLMPGVVNFAASAPGLSPLIKAAGGIHQDRSLPTFARQTFRRWFGRRGRRPGSGPRVVLFPDTFNNFFTPGVGAAAVEVLERYGYDVRIPRRILCCGRPLYDKGMLETTKGLLRQIMATLEPEIDDETWIVGLEPACVSALRDELVGLFPGDERATRVASRTLFLSEFLAGEQERIEIPTLAQAAVVHMHCHHHAVLNTQAERAILKRLGLDVDLLDSGCCGMAGSFGFEKEHYEVAMKCGERVLLPAVRGAPKDALIISNGFSCREQIAQATDRRALHLAEVLHMAMEGGGGAGSAYPERRAIGAGLKG
ncbi:MAG TPA: FAD-binding and (Fe-S)-binding domain-containing protein, partial [Geminicoccaceae bacterium]